MHDCLRRGRGQEACEGQADKGAIRQQTVPPGIRAEIGRLSPVECTILREGSDGGGVQRKIARRGDSRAGRRRERKSEDGVREGGRDEDGGGKRMRKDARGEGGE